MKDTRITVKMSSRTHEEMLTIKKMKNAGTIIEVYEEACREYIKNFYRKNALEKSQIESFIKDELRKMDKHLSSMLGRTGMDVSMILMGLCLFLRDYFTNSGEQLPSVDDVLDTLRKEGAKYFKDVRLMDRMGSE